MKKFAVLAAGCAAIAIGIGVAGYQAAADNGGTISGTVKFDGTAPAPKKVEVTKDKEVCGLKPHFEEALVVGSGGGIANAVVVLKDAKGTVKPGDVKFDQKGCDYVPHVLAFRPVRPSISSTATASCITSTPTQRRTRPSTWRSPSSKK